MGLVLLSYSWHFYGKPKRLRNLFAILSIILISGENGNTKITLVDFFLCALAQSLCHNYSMVGRMMFGNYCAEKQLDLTYMTFSPEKNVFVISLFWLQQSKISTKNPYYK